MHVIESFLNTAKEKNIIGSDEIDKLLVFANSHNKSAQTDENTFFSGLSAPVNEDDQNIVEPSETPRLVRGFHDILISIGIAVFLFAIWGLFGAFAVVLFVVILSEFFIKRQKLALPAFLLTNFFGAASLTLFAMIFGSSVLNNISPTLILGGLFGTLSFYYWRYRVPIALAGLIVIALLTLYSLTLILLGVSVAGNADLFLDQYPRVAGFIGLFFALVTFVIAMSFDVKDTNRVTRRSDVAFWMHLGLAPLLMYSLFFTIFGNDGFWWGKGTAQLDAFIALLVITFMILIGIIIDRRAFVTSGLVSLGAAVYILTEGVGLDKSTLFLVSMLALGVIVLSLGAGWTYSRRIIVSKLPTFIKNKVPDIS